MSPSPVEAAPLQLIHHGECACSTAFVCRLFDASPGLSSGASAAEEVVDVMTPAKPEGGCLWIGDQLPGAYGPFQLRHLA